MNCPSKFRGSHVEPDEYMRKYKAIGVRDDQIKGNNAAPYASTTSGVEIKYRTACQQ